jgi:predicted ABC-type ATPase
MAETLRMRVFAGPNGSGKSTMYREVKSTKVNGRSVDLGVYVNPDDIAKELRVRKRFDFGQYQVESNEVVFGRFARASGLIPFEADWTWFSTAQQWGTNLLKLRRVSDAERMAQLLAQHIVDLLLKAKKKFSFETVFSHPSKLKVMERANKLGYKVYLYFIATEDPEINKDRVRTRVEQGGHNVPDERIEDRYYRSLDLLRSAMHQSYHSFVFDNSREKPRMFAEFKDAPNYKRTTVFMESPPFWFKVHYLLAEPERFIEE